MSEITPGHNKTGYSSNTPIDNFSSIQDSPQKKLPMIASLLRIAGAIGIVGSMLMLLMQGWSVDSDINRYYKLLAETAILTLAGLLMSHVIREYKSARVCFGLALLSTIANFTILGALIFSTQTGNSITIDAPDHTLWEIPSGVSVIMLSILTTALLGGLALFSYSVFSRSNAKTLTISLMMCCSFIIIPWRSADSSSLLMALSAFIATITVFKINRRENIIKTMEHKFALATLFIPALVMLGRTLYLYKPNAMTALITFSAFYVLVSSLLNTLLASQPESNNAEPPAIVFIKTYKIWINLAATCFSLLCNR